MNVIIDTQCANLSSLKFAIERLNAPVVISADPSVINRAERVFLPGVGTAQHAMRNLIALDLVTTIRELTQPVLGICLGMQLLTEKSQESAHLNSESSCSKQQIDCLGIIPTTITALSTGLAPSQAQALRIPHMGWNTHSQLSDHPLFQHIQLHDYFYFVHSYCAPISSYSIAQCRYNSYNDPNIEDSGVEFAAAIAKDNFYGVQFHPERSGKIGSQLLQNFLEIRS